MIFFPLFSGKDKSGRDPIKGDFKIRTFAGPNRKRYTMAYFNYPLVQESEILRFVTMSRERKLIFSF